jgi:NitT/TauT family transport system ATP-binding protein
MEQRFGGRADLPVLADYASLAMDELFPLIDALQVLAFAHVGDGDIELTAIGRAYSEADLQERKRIFADVLTRNVPLAAHIRKVLEERPGHRAPETRFLTELEDHLSDDDAESVMETIINWGRHAELFAYDYDSEVFRLEGPDE